MDCYQQTLGSKDFLNLNFVKQKSNIYVIFTYPDNLSDEGKTTTNIALPKDRTLNQIYKDFIRSNPYIKTEKKDYFFYLIKGKDYIMLPKNEIVSNIGLQNSDKIILLYEKIFQNKNKSDFFERKIIPTLHLIKQKFNFIKPKNQKEIKKLY